MINSGWCNGSTTDSESVCEGSTPSPEVYLETSLKTGFGRFFF